VLVYELASSHSDIEILRDEVAVIGHHHANVKYFDVVFYSVCLSIVHPARWLEMLVRGRHDLNRIFRDVLAGQQIWCWNRRMYNSMVFYVKSLLSSALLAVSLNGAVRTLTPVDISAR
jgi:hypothetical protein